MILENIFTERVVDLRNSLLSLIVEAINQSINQDSFIKQVTNGNR